MTPPKVIPAPEPGSIPAGLVVPVKPFGLYAKLVQESFKSTPACAGVTKKGSGTFRDFALEAFGQQLLNRQAVFSAGPAQAYDLGFDPALGEQGKSYRT